MANSFDTVTTLKVVNDQADCATAQIQEFSMLISCSESQVQFLLKVVEDHCKAYPSSRKQTLTGQSAGHNTNTRDQAHNTLLSENL